MMSSRYIELNVTFHALPRWQTFGDDEERNGRREKWIDERLVELTIHGRAARLQRSAEDDERDDLGRVHRCVLLRV